MYRMDSTLTQALAAEIAEIVAQKLGPKLAADLRIELLRTPTTANPDELVDAPIAAKILGVASAAALRRSVDRGSCAVAPVRVGGRWRWRRGDLMAAVIAAPKK